MRDDINLRQWDGRHLTDRTRNQILKRTGAARMRVFDPKRRIGTADLRPDRINVYLDEDGNIREVKYG